MIRWMTSGVERVVELPTPSWTMVADCHRRRRWLVVVTVTVFIDESSVCSAYDCLSIIQTYSAFSVATLQLQV